MSEIATADIQAQLERQIDAFLDLLDRAGAQHVELNPLQTILERLAARGAEMDMDHLPPMMRMLLNGMGVE